MSDPRNAHMKAVSAVVMIARVLPDARFRRVLNNLVEQQQNEPPLGHADGSLTELQWKALKAVDEQLRSLHQCVEWARQVL